jgi:serine/threonine protein kinase
MSEDLLRLRTSGALAMSDLAHDTSQASSPGSFVGSSGLVYRPLRQLGEGGMARVFLACALGNAGFSKLVVLKVMRRYLEGSDYRGMFLQEARVSARLSHPNLVQVYEVVDNEEAPYIVMEYLEGKPLSELRRQPAITRDMMLTVMSEALVGIHYAHEVANFDGTSLNIVHRDVSPHNVFVTYDGAVKILDFGVAKIAANEGHTQTGEVRGKLSYMAPEQFLGQEIDRRADIFGMGAVLWEMVLGTPLWDKTDQGVMLQRLAMGDIPRPSPSANLDPELEAIIVRATAATPDQRYATALDMQRALIAYRDRQAKIYTPRDVGEALATAFEAERTKTSVEIRNALAEALAAADEPLAPSEVPPASELAPARRWPVVLFVVALVAFTVLALRLLAPKPEAPAASPQPPPPAVNSVATARLIFNVRPLTAQVEIDGQLRGTGQFEMVVPADAVRHRVIVSAPDHEPSTRLVSFAGTQELDVVLTASAPMPPPSSSAGEATGAKVRAVAGSARFGSGAKRTTSEPAAPGNAAAAGRCDPPYYFKDGIKTFRPECL